MYKIYISDKLSPNEIIESTHFNIEPTHDWTINPEDEKRLERWEKSIDKEIRKRFDVSKDYYVLNRNFIIDPNGMTEEKYISYIFKITKYCHLKDELLKELKEAEYNAALEIVKAYENKDEPTELDLY